MKLTPAVLAFRDALAQELAKCSHGDGWRGHWERNREWWERLADDAISDSQPLRIALDKLRREALESGASPALAVLLTELEEALPGQYQDGLARAVTLLSQEMGMHYGSVFEAGRRVGRAEHSRADGDQIRD